MKYLESDIGSDEEEEEKGVYKALSLKMMRAMTMVIMLRIIVMIILIIITNGALDEPQLDHGLMTKY